MRHRLHGRSADVRGGPGPGRHRPAQLGGTPAIDGQQINATITAQDRLQTPEQFRAIVLRSNFEAPALILGAFANRFVARGSGSVVGISSVAGDRGRGSNYVYGSAKAGFTAFLSGLRNRLSGTPVQVLTVKPGFVATRMTEGMKLSPALTAQPAAVAAAIEKAVRGKRDVIYVKPVWALVMLIITHLPEAVFKRTRL